MLGKRNRGRRDLAFILVLGALVLITFPQEGDAGISCTLSGPGAGDGDSIICGQSVTFNIRLFNDLGENITRFSHGFRLYSPDVVDWSIPVFDTAGGLGGFSPIWVGSTGYGVDGSDADTIYITGAYFEGIPDWFNEIVLTITTQVDCPYIYRTICIDSCSVPIGGGEWEWLYNNNNSSYIPTWDGPYCFDIIGPDDGMWWLEPFMRDFDQKRGANWKNYCGPAAAANWMWWFDVGHHPAWGLKPPAIGDVAAHIINVLAGMMSTNAPDSGTSTANLQNGIREYIDWRGLTGRFVDSIYFMPSFDFCREELINNQGVILQLGFWKCIEKSQDGDAWVVTWHRLSGHYVTMAGIDPDQTCIAISDPARDAAEIPSPNPRSRVIGLFHNHPEGHIWGESASHDAYDVTIPAHLNDIALWEIFDYWLFNNMDDTSGSNMGQTGPYRGYIYDTEPEWADTGLVLTEVEAAYIIGPRTGDANSDGILNVSDPVFLINYIFKGGEAPANPSECDTNCDGNINVGDAVYLVNYVFKGGPAPCRL